MSLAVGPAGALLIGRDGQLLTGRCAEEAGCCGRLYRKAVVCDELLGLPGGGVTDTVFLPIPTLCEQSVVEATTDQAAVTFVINGVCFTTVPDETYAAEARPPDVLALPAGAVLLAAAEFGAATVDCSPEDCEDPACNLIGDYVRGEPCGPSQPGGFEFRGPAGGLYVGRAALALAGGCVVLPYAEEFVPGESERWCVRFRPEGFAVDEVPADGLELAIGPPTPLGQQPYLTCCECEADAFAGQPDDCLGGVQRVYARTPVVVGEGDDARLTFPVEGERWCCCGSLQSLVGRLATLSARRVDVLEEPDETVTTVETFEAEGRAGPIGSVPGPTFVGLSGVRTREVSSTDGTSTFEEAPLGTWFVGSCLIQIIGSWPWFAGVPAAPEGIRVLIGEYHPDDVLSFSFEITCTRVRWRVRVRVAPPGFNPRTIDETVDAQLAAPALGGPCVEGCAPLAGGGAGGVVTSFAEVLG